MNILKRCYEALQHSARIDIELLKDIQTEIDRDDKPIGYIKPSTDFEDKSGAIFMYLCEFEDYTMPVYARSDNKKPLSDTKIKEATRDYSLPAYYGFKSGVRWAEKHHGISK